MKRYSQKPNTWQIDYWLLYSNFIFTKKFTPDQWWEKRKFTIQSIRKNIIAINKKLHLSQILIENELKSYFENNPFCTLQDEVIQKNRSPCLAGMNRIRIFFIMSLKFLRCTYLLLVKEHELIKYGQKIYQTGCVLYNLL